MSHSVSYQCEYAKSLFLLHSKYIKRISSQFKQLPFCVLNCALKLSLFASTFALVAMKSSDVWISSQISNSMAQTMEKTHQNYSRSLRASYRVQLTFKKHGLIKRLNALILLGTLIYPCHLCMRKVFRLKKTVDKRLLTLYKAWL